MNEYCKVRISLAQELVNHVVAESGEEILAAFITSSVARGDANDNSDIDIHVVTRDEEKPFRQYAELVRDIVVEWIWEPRGNYQNTEDLLTHFAHPYNVDVAIVLYDPEGWLEEIKRKVKPFVYDKGYIQLRVQGLWRVIQGHLETARGAGEYDEFVRGFRGYMTTSALLPIAATAQDPSARKMLIQAMNGLKLSGLEPQSDIFLKLYGCENIHREETQLFLDHMIQIYDHCIEVQASDYHGINRPKRNYHYRGIQELIDAGYHREAFHPILDWTWVAEQRISKDTGVKGWWHDLLQMVLSRLHIAPEYREEKMKLVNDTADLLQEHYIEKGIVISPKRVLR